MAAPLQIFYAEPEADRWLPLDRYPRRLVRRLLRGKPSPGGHRRIFLNLCAGLRRLGVPHRVNDYRHARLHPGELVCIIGKPFLLDRIEWRNPILFGAAVHSHPLDDPQLAQRRPVRRVLVPGEWMRKMYEPVWNDQVSAWPVGIDTETWREDPPATKRVDVLLYDKIRWQRQHYEPALLEPIRQMLRNAGLRFTELRYGRYREEQFRARLAESRAMVFLCEHETQGIAYQQALSCGVPIFAWDRGGHWQDPAYYPEKVRFAPVTSVPYWDGRCGLKFGDLAEFASKLGEFWDAVQRGAFAPRCYVLDNLTLERCARQYVEIARAVGP
jgi:glycosyltransferase involved in cell wall biosynthesis